MAGESDKRIVGTILSWVANASQKLVQCSHSVSCPEGIKLETATSIVRLNEYSCKYYCTTSIFTVNK